MEKTINTPIGSRSVIGRGETTTPTYYGAFKRGDKIRLAKTGKYRARDIIAADGITESGKLNVWLPSGFYYEVAPKN